MPYRRNWLRGAKGRTIWVAASLGAMSCAAMGQTPAPPPGQTAPADPLTTLNDAFRTAYHRTKEANLDGGGPVILMEGDNVVLRRGGTRVEVPYTPAIYHILKAVAHVPLALDVILAPHAGESTLNDAVLAELREYRGLMAAAEPGLAAHGLDAEQLERQKTILAGSRGFLDSVVESRRCPRDARVAFARRMTPMVMKNVGEAARAELDALHARVSAWRREMSADEWQALRVVILGSALPRKQSLTVQYFSRLLGEPGEGRRIIYAESVRDEAQALDLMATRAVDTNIGVDFFNDPARMHRDLLSDAARDYLPLLIDRP